MSPLGSDCTRRPLRGPLQFDRLGSRPWPPLRLNLSGNDFLGSSLPKRNSQTSFRNSPQDLTHISHVFRSVCNWLCLCRPIRLLGLWRQGSPVRLLAGRLTFLCQESRMLTKCANPDCSVSSWEDARFFRFNRQPEPNRAPANPHSVQHFWLCRICSALYTLEHHKQRGIIIRPRSWLRQPLALGRVIRSA
jgi:hypothetical protein